MSAAVSVGDQALRCQLIERPALATAALRRFAELRLREWVGASAPCRWDEVLLPAGPALALCALEFDGAGEHPSADARCYTTPVLCALAALGGRRPADGLYGLDGDRGLSLVAVRCGAPLFVRHLPRRTADSAAAAADTVAFVRERGWWTAQEPLAVRWLDAASGSPGAWPAARLMRAPARAARERRWRSGSLLALSGALALALSALALTLLRLPRLPAPAVVAAPALSPALAALAELRAALAADPAPLLPELGERLQQVARALEALPALRLERAVLDRDGVLALRFDSAAPVPDPVAWSRTARQLEAALAQSLVALQSLPAPDLRVSAGGAAVEHRWDSRWRPGPAR